MKLPWYLKAEHMRFTDDGLTMDVTANRFWIAWRLLRLAVKFLFYRDPA